MRVFISNLSARKRPSALWEHICRVPEEGRHSSSTWSSTEIPVFYIVVFFAGTTV